MNQGMTASPAKKPTKKLSRRTAGLLSGMLLGLAALQAQASNPTVVISSVEEAGEVAPVRVNGLNRSRHDILLPARAEGQLMWTLDEGARVQPGDVLAQIDRRQLEISLQEENHLLERATVNLAYLEGEAARLQALESKNMASRTQLAELVSRRDIARNDISVAHTRIARIEDNLARTALVSPIQGVIVERLKERGEYARVGETVVRVVDPTALEITAAVPVINLNRIDFDAPVQVSLPELAFPADLKAVIHAGDQSSQTFEVIVVVPEEMTPNLVSGQFVEVEVPLSASKLLYVPRDAVVLRSEGSYVFRINDENVAERISVVLGKGRGTMVSVLSAEGALHQGDRVAIRGVENLQDGQQVTPVAS